MNENTGLWQLDAIDGQRVKLGKAYLEFLRMPAMSAGVYALAAGSEDTQSPHEEDEIYYVVRGKGHIRAGEDDRAIGPGSVIFVAANVVHRFHDVVEDLTLLVFFAPAETDP